jgi:hypothetical protein
MGEMIEIDNAVYVTFSQIQTLWLTAFVAGVAGLKSIWGGGVNVIVIVGCLST